MNDLDRTFRINIKLTTIGQVFVRARSPESAVRAVQQDLDDGGWTLDEDILQIENEIPHDSSEAIFDEMEPDCDADYEVYANGFLRRVDEGSTVSTEGIVPKKSPLTFDPLSSSLASLAR